MADDKGKSDAEKVKADHAKTGRPVSPTEDPTDHSVPAGEIAKQLDPKGTSGASVNAASMDKAHAADEAKEQQELAEGDKSLAGRIRRSGLYYVTDNSIGSRYVGISPQNDPKASAISKRVSAIAPLDGQPPETGVEVRLPDGTSFTIGDGFGPGSLPSDWEKVKRPDGSPLFA